MPVFFRMTLYTVIDLPLKVILVAARLSWVLREVFRGFSEEARTRGFPSPSLGGFGFIVAIAKYSRNFSDCLIGNLIGIYKGGGNVAFGS